MLKEKDFIEIAYTGRIKETNQVFDTTDINVAKKENIYNENFTYIPRIICVGQKHILQFIDKNLIGKKVNDSFILELTPENGFGLKDQNLVKVVSTNELREQKINPFPGLQLNASGLLGTVRSVNGGRTTIDFNHPLAGKNLVYEIKINKLITENKEKLVGLLNNLLGLNSKDYELKLENNKAEVNLKSKIPENFKEEFKKKVKELIPELETNI